MDDLIQTLSRADQRMRDLYWKDKDLAASLEQAAGALALESAAREAGEEALGKVKTISYNVASFAWPGWAEPGIEITQEQAEIGMRAARLNIELGEELARPALPMSRGHWMLGGHLLTVGKSVDAARHFHEAVRLAEEAGEPGDIGISRACLAVARYLIEPCPETLAKIEEDVRSLAAVENGDAYTAQVSALLQVLGVDLEAGQAAGAP